MSEGWMSCVLSAWAQSLLKVGRGSHVKWVPIVFLLLLHPFSPIVIAHPYFILHIPFTLFSPTPGGLGALEALYCVLSKPCRSFLVHCLAYGRRYRSAVCVLASSPAQKDNSYKSWRGRVPRVPRRGCAYSYRSSVQLTWHWTAWFNAPGTRPCTRTRGTFENRRRPQES